jgi:site-specific recombinase XerD
VFCDSEGKLPSPFKVSMAFRRACKRAGIENLRFHDLRHDFASGMRQSGADIQVIKELLGHKDLHMTLKYSHLSPENLRKR